MSANDNVMLKVNGTSLPCPASFQWSLQDISASDAGRTQDGQMQKMLVTQKRKLVVEWSFKDWSEAATILQTVNASEYLSVEYPDMLSGTYETRTFYVGDRTVPVKLWWINRKLVEKVSFDFIER